MSLLNFFNSNLLFFNPNPEPPSLQSGGLQIPQIPCLPLLYVWVSAFIELTYKIISFQKCLPQKLLKI